MRLRFAPSPTGLLHIGGARTALYNWLLARGRRGSLLLRIEDTDRERSTQENVDQILEALEWLGIDYDEGPVFQTHNEPRHREVIEQLLGSGAAYRSTATGDDVKAYKEQHGAAAGFRGTPEDEGAVRLRVPAEGSTIVRDVIRGETAFAHEHLDDPVIARADGTPLYNLAVAIDDHDAGITHVVRGADHYSNTPKQLLVLEALGAPQPIYAHLPLLHGPDGKKLSKRHGAASVQELRDQGYLPEAVLNYIALLGWGFDESQEFFTIEELQKNFSLERVSKSPAIFELQKLHWMNGRYLRDLEPTDLAGRLQDLLGREEDLLPAVEIAHDKISTLAEFWPLCSFFYEGPADDPAAWEKVFKDEQATSNLRAVREGLAGLEDPWSTDEVERTLQRVLERLGAKPKAVFQPLRVAVAGTTISPGIYETVALLGRQETLARVDRALARLG